jgi:hypothetical protein
MIAFEMRVFVGFICNAPQEPISAARADCIVLPTRTVLLEHLPHGGTVAEIGTLRGDFAREILRVANPKELHLVDKFIGPRAREMGKIRRSKGACMFTSPILQRRSNPFLMRFLIGSMSTLNTPIRVSSAIS